MKGLRWSSLILALLLMAFSWLGNLMHYDPHHMSVFPWAVMLLVFPAVLFPALWLEAHSRNSDTAHLRSTAWSIVWPAGLIFAASLAPLAAIRFTRPGIEMLSIVFIGTLVFTVAFGCLSGFACAPFISKHAAGKHLDMPQS